jgi:hypothetical protein
MASPLKVLENLFCDLSNELLLGFISAMSDDQFHGQFAAYESVDTHKRIAGSD